MQKIKKFNGIILSLLSLNISLLAQELNNDAGLACGTGIVFLIIWLLVMFVILAVFIAIIVFIIKWIRKDAVARNMPNADSIKWLGLLGLVGLVIYLLKRPDGQMPPSNNRYAR